jgi:hypothetical protein
MSEQLIVVRSMEDWAEQMVCEIGEGQKMSSAAVTYKYTGALVGESKVGYALLYMTPSKALFSGYETVTIHTGELKGTLVLRHDGVFENGFAQIQAQVVSEAGAGAFAGLAGPVRIEADQQDPTKSSLVLNLHSA